MQDDTIKIGDMGISRAVQGGQLQVSKIGTPIYISPEVLRKQPFDYKIDIWALGCLMHYMACLEPAFSIQIAEQSPRNHHNLSGKQKLEDLILNASPKMIPDSYSNNLRILISRLLDKNPQNRPSSEELLNIITTEHRASSSFGFQIFGMTYSSIGGSMTRKIKKPPSVIQSIEYPIIRNEREKLNEKVRFSNKIVSSSPGSIHQEDQQAPAFKLPGLSLSTQASTFNVGKKTHKNDKVYKKETVMVVADQSPIMKNTIDFKAFNMAQLNPRFERNMTCQLSVKYEKDEMRKNVRERIKQESNQISRSASNSSRGSEHIAVKRNKPKIETNSQLRVVVNRYQEMQRTIQHKNNMFGQIVHQKFEPSPTQVFKHQRSSQRPQIEPVNLVKQRMLSDSMNKTGIVGQNLKKIRKSNQIKLGNITNHANKNETLRLLISPGAREKRLKNFFNQSTN